MSQYPKSYELAAKLDVDLNKRLGYNANASQRNLNNLIDWGEVEVGHRQSCGKTDPTAFEARAWDKVLKMLRKEGAQIEEIPVKWGNAWATAAGGFWTSTKYKRTI